MYLRRYFCSNNKNLFQYLATYSATLTEVGNGMHYGWTSPSLPILQSNSSAIKISTSDGSWLATAPLLTSFLGSACACVLVDLIGRKGTIILSTVPSLVAWLVIAYATTFTDFYIARSIAGVADGWVSTIIPMYVGEISDPNLRGFLGASVPVRWIYGILLINILGAYLSISTTALVSCFFPLFTVITMIWMPESPYYFIMRDKCDAARKSLQTLRGTDDVEKEFNRINNAIKEQIAIKTNTLELFTTKSNRNTLFFILTLRTVQHLSGAIAITFYTEYIFREAGGNISAQLSAIIYCLMQLVTAVVSSAIVDKTGRRPLLCISCIGSATALFAEGIYFYIKLNIDVNVDSFSIVSVISLILFVIMFNLGLQTVPVILVGEVFPANVKAFALCIIDIHFAALAMATSKFFQIMTDSFGMYVPFFTFGVCCSIGLIFIIFVVPETNNQTLEDIQESFKR